MPRNEVDETFVGKAKDQFAKARRFIYSCQKPSTSEWKKLALATAMGIGLVGISGYVIKAISYPIFTKLGGMKSVMEE